ncbi:GNAT family N-acetyltransferase [Larkinella terrae]|uniref:GNAT family N-acetyltransferase n=1 Tax=Larkinella terrae TaxID=2025311 RepID=A0A7K0EPL9_9BACT|nr:GNAT family N-acetyltransferase [Larkinella terrae]MRS63501.1 GNAT family N-acetyltransferase [Larkinella terrae]
MSSAFLYSPRLLFIASSPSLLRVELSDRQQLGQILNVDIPADWPPGEYDQDAMRFFLDQQETGGPDAIGWYGWYVVALPTADTPATLVAGGGYFGPPDAEGSLEIGYSVSEHWRSRGFATEIVDTLVNHAWKQPGVTRIIAHTLPDNQASIGVLTKNGFYPIESDDPEKLCFELLPQV